MSDNVSMPICQQFKVAVQSVLFCWFKLHNLLFEPNWFCSSKISLSIIGNNNHSVYRYVCMNVNVYRAARVPTCWQ